jgi:phosphonate transport system permease protein
MSAPALPRAQRQRTRSGTIATAVVILIAMHEVALESTEFKPALLVDGAQAWDGFSPRRSHRI